MKSKSTLLLKTISTVCAIKILIVPPDASAGLLPNGSFDDGIDAWTTVGAASIVANQLFLSNAAGFPAFLVAPLLGLPAFPTDNGTVAMQASAIEQTFETTAAGTISFDYRFLTNEAIGSPRDQTAYYLNGVITLLSSPHSPGVIAGTGVAGYPRGLPYRTITVNIPAGINTLGFLAYDTVNNTTDTGMLIDNVTTSAPLASAVPEPATYGSVAGVLLLGIGMVSIRRRMKAATV